MKLSKNVFVLIIFSFYMFTAITSFSQDITSNLEAYWSMDDYKNLVENNVSPDSSGLNRNAIVNAGFPFPVTGKNSNAANFDGSSEFTAPWKGIGGGAPRTIALWVRTTENGNAFVNWGTNATGQNWRFGIRGQAPMGMPGPPPGSLSVDINGFGTFGRATISTGEWMHVACVYDGGALYETRFYVNGVAEPASPPPPPDREIIPVNTNVNSNDSPDITIGSFEGRDGPVRINGTMDDIRIYSRALSADDIRAIFELGSTKQDIAVRSYSQLSVEVGASVSVTLTSPAKSNAALTEFVPDGWTVTAISGNGIANNNIITWNNPDTSESYTITLDDGAAETRFAGDHNGLVTSGEYEITVLTEGAGTFTQTTDIGNVQIGGSAQYHNGLYFVQGSGSGISGQEDSFRFLFKPLTGPFTIRGNVLVTPETDDYLNAIGGIMVRSGLSPNASNGFLFLRGDLIMGAQSRAVAGGLTSSIHELVENQLGDMEITRNGSILEFFYINNDGRKISMGQTIIEDLVDPVYAGLAVTSNDFTTYTDLEMTSVELIEEDFSAVRTITNSRSGRIHPGDTLTVTVDLFNRNPLLIQLTEEIPLQFNTSNMQVSGGTIITNSNGLLEWTLNEAGSFQLTYEIHIPKSLKMENPSQNEVIHSYRSIIKADSDTLPRVVGDNTIRIPLLMDESEISSHDITTRLEGHWSFEEGTGATAADSSGNNRIAVVRDGAPIWVQGVQGTALEFNGDDSIEVPGYYAISGNAPRTSSFWMRTRVLGGAHSILIWGGPGPGAKWDHILNNGEMGGVVGAVRIDVLLNFMAGNTSLIDDKWHHVAVVFSDGGTVMTDAIIYVDGFNDGVSATDLASPNLEINTTGSDGNSDVVVIGSRVERGETQYYTGLLDEVRIYNRALTHEQIQALYLTERPNMPPDTMIEDFMLYK